MPAKRKLGVGAQKLSGGRKQAKTNKGDGGKVRKPSPGTGSRANEVLMPVHQLKTQYLLKLGQVNRWRRDADAEALEADSGPEHKKTPKKKSSKPSSSSSSEPSDSIDSTDDDLINYAMWWPTTQIILPTAEHFPPSKIMVQEDADSSPKGLIRPVHKERAQKISKAFTDAGDIYNPDHPVRL
jgi:hypothetical protein